jgi:D-aminopeptidase
MGVEMAPRKRLRDLGIKIGTLETGPLNAITDVPGVLVGMSTLIADHPTITRTGVTAILPRSDIHNEPVFAGFHSFNGIGEMTGQYLIEETGQLSSPILLTCTHQLGLAYQSVLSYGVRRHGGFTFTLPVVGETHDGWLNDAESFPLREEHIIAALETARDGIVPEGSCGGGTGSIAYEFKAGTGTASRVAAVMDGSCTVGALVQANHGNREHLLVNGIPVGRQIGKEEVPAPWDSTPDSSSILIVIATDAPLLPHDCRRLAKRASLGLAKTGGYGLMGSGDLFLAFATGNHLVINSNGRMENLHALDISATDNLVVAAAEAVEEAILNALVAADTMVGQKGRTAHALPLDRLTNIMSAYS